MMARILFNLACCRNVECEMVMAVFAGEKEVGLRNEIHANEHVVVVNIGSIGDEVAVKIAVGQTKMDEIDSHLLIATNAHQAGMLERLKAESLDNAGGNHGDFSSRVPAGTFRKKAFRGNYARFNGLSLEDVSVGDDG